MLLLRVLDDDSALDPVPGAGLHDADVALALSLHLVSPEAPEDVGDVGAALGLAVDHHRVPHTPELRHLPLQDHWRAQQSHLVHSSVTLIKV